MKILFLNPTGQLGGAETSLLSILASLRAAEPDWQLHLVAGSEGPLLTRAEALGVSTTVIPFSPALARLGDAGAGGPAGSSISRLALFRGLVSASVAIIRYTGRLRRAMKTIAADIIHSNGLKMHVLGLWSRPRRTPLIWHMHDYASSRPVMARLLRRYAGACFAILANSGSVADDIRSVCGEGSKIYPVYNAVDLERFSPSGPALDLDGLAGLPVAEPGTVRVGLVATLARWKGHEVFFRALSLLPRDLPVRGYVVGGAIYETGGSQRSLKELRELAGGLGLGERVGFTGFIEDVAPAMRALDVVVHASTEPEPFGLVIVEAMACGRAVIASGAGGASEIIEDGVNALSHPPGDDDALAERIKKLTSDATLRAELGRAGRATAEERFDQASLAASLIPVYLKGVESRFLTTA